MERVELRGNSRIFRPVAFRLSFQLQPGMRGIPQKLGDFRMKSYLRNVRNHSSVRQGICDIGDQGNWKLLMNCTCTNFLLWFSWGREAACFAAISDRAVEELEASGNFPKESSAAAATKESFGDGGGSAPHSAGHRLRLGILVCFAQSGFVQPQRFG